VRCFARRGIAGLGGGGGVEEEAGHCSSQASMWRGYARTGGGGDGNSVV